MAEFARTGMLPTRILGSRKTSLLRHLPIGGGHPPVGILAALREQRRAAPAPLNQANKLAEGSSIRRHRRSWWLAVGRGRRCSAGMP
jgi:hypothetical protein